MSMRTHLTMDELLALRSGEASRAAREHLDVCTACAAEYERLAQQIASLRALDVRRPPRDRWPTVRTRVLAERRRSAGRRLAGGALAIAAAAALAIGLGRGPASAPRSVTDSATPVELASLQEQSQSLEQVLAEYGTSGRVINGRAASIIADIEDRIALVDVGIAEAHAGAAPNDNLLALWRGRVELMDALVNAHVTRANYVGF